MSQSKPAEMQTDPLLRCLIEFKLQHLHNKLKDNNITTIVAFSKLAVNELTRLCDKLELNDNDVTKLKQLYEKTNSIPIKRTKSVKKSAINLTQLDDMQHIFETYFTEIESSCNAAQKQIDEKFQEIIKTLKTKQKQLNTQINEFKLNKLENVNKEISDIMQYTNAYNSASETINDNKFNKYKNSSDLIKHIQSLTPLMSVNFNSKSIDNINNELQSLTNVTTTNYMSFPNIILSKPSEFMDKNEGYCMRLNWKFKYYNKDINKDNIIIKYKLNTNENKNSNNSDEKMDLCNSEWNMCKHGSISSIKGENEIVMTTQLITVMKLNKLYECQIEYIMKQPINIIIKSNIEQFINIKEELKEEELMKINLEYYSHRSYSLTRHPKYLLLNSDTKQYWSSFNKDFQRDECDWIIYKYKPFEINKKWIPKKIIFKNYKSNQDVRKMIVYIGNVKNKQWYPLTKEHIQPKLSKELQYFDVDNFDGKLVNDENCIYIKLEFLENYGENNPDMCRFCCRHFRLMGVH